MSTNSTIALEFADKTVQQIYCHYDGYLVHNGKILLEHYSNPFVLRDLIDLGDLSALGTNIVDCEFTRSTKNNKSEKFSNYEDFVMNADHQEYSYILRTNGVWYVKKYDSNFEPLEDCLTKHNQSKI